MFVKMGYHLGKRSPDVLFVKFGNLTADTDATVSAISISKLLKGFLQTVGRLVEHHCTMLFAKVLKPCLPAFLLRQEALEHKTVTRKSTGHQGRNTSGSTWQTLYLYTLADSLANQEETGIADARSAGIADKGDILSGKQTLDNTGRSAMLIELMV